MNYEHWEYEPETRTVLATDIEDGVTLATVEPYDDADDIGRLIAAAPEMYELLEELIEPGKIGTADYSIYRAIEEAERLLNRINSEEADYE